MTEISSMSSQSSGLSPAPSSVRSPALQSGGNSASVFNPYGLIRYGMAAGALGAISLSSEAAEQPYAPAGGLPVTIDVLDGPFVIDIDNDSEADFVIFRETAYGGGFAIGAYKNTDAFDRHKIRAHRYQVPGSIYGSTWVVREEPGSWISKFDSNPDYGLYHYGTISMGNAAPMLIDIKGNVSWRHPFQPFRNKPGFIAMVLGPTGSDHISNTRIAWLEIVVSPDGSELKILSGGYDDSIFVDNKMMHPFTPPPSGLAGLATGAE